MKKTPLIITAIALFVISFIIATTLPQANAAAPPTVTDDGLGRRVVTISLPSGAVLTCSAQGQLLDSNNNGTTDSLRGRAACKETRNVRRLRIHWVQVQSQFADTWATALINNTDAVSEATPAYAISYTPVSWFCPPPGDFGLIYRVVQSFGIRSDDGTAVNFTMASHPFEARAVAAAQNDVC